MASLCTFPRILQVVDVYESQTASCLDGSENCPVVGTFGSYGFYALGIFMACVYLLGPKTAYGQSEQNPAYWIQVLIAAKRTGAKITWFDPVQNQMKNRSLSPNDCRVWARFFMSFLINGVGFHILVHALPIQGLLNASEVFSIRAHVSPSHHTFSLCLLSSRYSVISYWCRVSSCRDDVLGRFGT